MFTPLNIKSHYSLLDALSRPTQIASRISELGYMACALTDHNTLSGTIQFIKALKDTCGCSHQKSLHANGKECILCDCKSFEKKKIKPLLGCEFDTDGGRINVISKNLAGWKALMKATSECSMQQPPFISLERLGQLAQGNWLIFVGRPGSILANALFDNYQYAYAKRTLEDCRPFLIKDKNLFPRTYSKLNELFNKDNIFLEVFLMDQYPAAQLIEKQIRFYAGNWGWKTIAAIDSHYCCSEDAVDHRVLLCSASQITLSILRNRDLQDTKKEGSFIRSSNYFIPHEDWIKSVHTPDEIHNTQLVSDMCEEYDIFNKPLLPKATDRDSNQYLRELCIKGWAKIDKILPREEQGIYQERMRTELNVIAETGILADYFLVVKDYVDYFRNNIKGLINPSRGSVGGTLVSHVLGITDLDPIEYDLLFERFYNAGRNTKDNISLPDIDIDFQRSKREQLIEYVVNKYGENNVAQMTTFHRIQGRSSLKDVLRAHEACTFEEMNKITKFIPDEAKIADDLQEMREEEGESSIIKWALQNNVKELKEWAYLDGNNVLGPLGKYFAQAIRLEGTKRQASKHASGIVISPVPIDEVCPMTWDKSSKKRVVGFEMKDAEAVGLVKFDILGLALLDKINDVFQDINNGN